MSIILSERSLSRLSGAHPDLVRVIKRAAAMSSIDFTVLEVLRSVARQKQLVASGASKTMNSRHLPGKDGLARAVDIAPLDDQGKVSWAWPLYNKLAPIIKQAAKMRAFRLSGAAIGEPSRTGRIGSYLGSSIHDRP